MTQYLILHKVRGEPSFDCAEEIEPGMWITNSGYRAYPFLKWNLTDIPEVQTVELLANGLPADWPDHFQVKEAPASMEVVRQVLAGLMPKLKDRRF